MASSSVGNIYIGLQVDTRGTRAFTSAANLVAKDSDRIRHSLGGTTRSVTALRATMSQGWRSRIFGDMIRQASQANNEVAQLRATMLGLTALTGTSVTGAFAATFILQTADSYNRLNNQLRTVTDSEENRIAVMQRLFNLSQATRSDMQSTITMYARISRAAESFGKSQEDIIRVTETVQKAFAIGGASQAEAQGAAIQLSQGIASDRFSGEEYRSVAENAPVLLQEMARHLDVNIGKLREMAHAGELTGKVVTEAILGASAAIDEDFGKTVSTVGQGLTRVGNAFLMYVGETDSSVGATRRLAEALANLAENFDEIAPWLTGAALAGGAILGGRVAGGALGGMAANLANNTRAARENAAAVMSGNAVALNSARANELRARSVRDATAAELQATQAKVAAGQGDVASLRQTLALTQAQRAKAVAMMELNRGIQDATGRTGLYSNALRVQAESTKAVLVTSRALCDAEAALAANKALLTTQTGAATAAAVAHNAALAATTVRARAAAASLSAMRAAGALAARLGGGIMGLLGGPAGIAFTAAIAGMGLYMANAAKAEERTVRLKREMHALGLISDDVAGAVSDAASSIEELGASAIRNKLRDVADELERMKAAQNVFDQIFAYDPTMLGNIIQQLERVQVGFTPDGRGVNTLTPEQLRAAEMLREIAISARDGTATVEVLQAKLDLLGKNNPDMAPWLDEMIVSLQQSIPYMEGLQTRAEQLEAQLQSMSASGVSSGWIENLMAADEALTSSRDAAEAVREMADAQMEAAGLSEREADIRKLMNELRDEAIELGHEESAIQDAVLRQAAEGVILAQERADAQNDYNEQIGDFREDIEAATSSFEDMQAAATIEKLLEDFATGTMRAETLKSRLSEIQSVNLSDPMNDLITKIMAAVGGLAQLLGIFMSFPGATSQSGPVYGRGAVGRSRRELQAKQEIGQEVLDTAIEDAGLSERDAWIKEKTADLRDQAAALGGVATNAEETAAQLWDMDQAQEAAEASGKAATDAAEKYAEGMAELSRELAAAPLDPFLKEVLSSAEGMGIAAEELDAFVAAVASGGLDAAPEKFRKIAEAMREINAVGLMQDLSFDRSLIFKSDSDAEAMRALRDAGIEYGSAQGQLISQQMALNDNLAYTRDLATGFMETFRQGLADGKSLWQAFGEAGLGALDKIASRLVEMGTMGLLDMLFGAITGAVGGNFIGGSFGAPALKLGFQTGIPGYASGTNDHPGGLAQLFEQGAEIVDLPKHTRVIPHELSKQIAAKRDEGGNSYSVSISISGSRQDAAEIAREVRKQLPDAMNAVTRNPYRRTPG